MAGGLVGLEVGDLVVEDLVVEDWVAGGWVAGGWAPASAWLSAHQTYTGKICQMLLPDSMGWQLGYRMPRHTTCRQARVLSNHQQHA